MIRVHRDREGLRGRVVAVDTGAERLFADLDDAVAFIKAMVNEATGDAAGAESLREGEGGIRGGGE